MKSRRAGALARLQQAITLGWLTLCGVWVLVAGSPFLAAIGVAVLVCGHAVFLGLESVLLAFVNRRDPAPPATLAQRVGAWWGEATIAPRVFCWRQPFRSNAVPDHQASNGRGVLLVHGFVCNRGFWTPWLQRLRERDVTCMAINLEPVFGSIDDYLPAIDDAVRELERRSGLPPVIVGHSMGGLAVRAWLARFDADERVHRIITIGAPHHGTWLARFSFSQNAREMRQGSDWYQALERRESVPRHRRFICFYSHCDNVVFPASTATLAGADNRHVPGSAHIQMILRPAVLDTVWQALSEEPLPAQSSMSCSS